MPPHETQETAREFLDYRETWTTYYKAMLIARRYRNTRAYKEMRARGWRIEAQRYKNGWALYAVREHDKPGG